MEAALRTAFATGRGYKPRVGDLTFEYCDAARHAMWPQAARIAPLLDDGTEATVVLVDVHDPLDAQREAVDRLDGELAADGLALTFWKAQSCLADEFRGADGESVAPPPRLRAARTAAMAAADEGWNVDAGLALSRPAFRAAVREIVGKQGFGRHLAACALLYEYEGSCGTDEALLTLFLFALRKTRAETPHTALGALCRAHAVPWTHPLRARSDAPPRHAWPKMAPPEYSPQLPRQ